MALDRNDIPILQSAFEQALERRGIGGGGGFSGGGGGGNNGGGTGVLDKAADLAATALKGLGGAAISAAQDGLDTWRNLSKVGASFSNDIIGMGVAAAGSRVSLAEFADTISRNGASMAGLGGNVTRGAEAFAKLSKQMNDDGVATDLRQMGLSAKDINETLALQVGTMRTSARMDEQGRQEAIRSAAALAKEMDLTSKLMGKSREQQAEEMRERQRDAQVQARLRLDAAKMKREGKTDSQIAEYQTQVMAALKEAQDTGKGQMAKEVFATGGVTSEVGGMQASLYGAEADAITGRIKALKAGDMEGAKVQADRARTENMKNQDNEILLHLASLGPAVGALEPVLKENIQANQTLYDSTTAIAKELGVAKDSTAAYSAAQREARDIAISAQKGLKAKTGTDGKIARDKDGKVQYEDASGVTRGAVSAGAMVDTAKAKAYEVGAAALKESANDIGAAVSSGIDDGVRKATDYVNSQLSGESGILNSVVNGTKEAIGSITGLFSDGKAKVQIVPTDGAPTATQTQGGRASGGPITAGTPVLVGDRADKKPELFVSNTGGTIITPDAKPQTASGSAGMDFHKIGLPEKLKAQFDELIKLTSTKLKEEEDAAKQAIAVGRERIAAATKEGDALEAIDEKKRTVEQNARITELIQLQQDESKKIRAADATTQVIQKVQAEQSSKMGGIVESVTTFGTKFVTQMTSDISKELPKVTGTISQMLPQAGKMIESIPVDTIKEDLSKNMKIVQDLMAKAGPDGKGLTNVEQGIMKASQELVTKYQEDLKSVAAPSATVKDATATPKPALDFTAATEARRKEMGLDILTPNKSAAPRLNDVSKVFTDGVADLNKIRLPGMPSLGAKIQTAAKEIPKSVQADEKKAAADKKADEEKAAAAAKAKPAESAKPVGKVQSQATLTDVVNKLDQLNSNITQLVTKTEEFGRKQLSATKNLSTDANAR